MNRKAVTRVTAAIVLVIVIAGALAGVYFFQQMAGPATMTTTAATSTAPVGTIPIGDISDTTGCGAFIGQQELNGAKLAVAEINAAGGVMGKQFQLFTANDNCDPTIAVTAASDMIREHKVIAIVGWTYTGQALAAQPVLMSNKVIGIGDSTGGIALTQNVLNNYTTYKYWFQGNYNTTGWAVQTAGFLHEVVHAKTAYYVSEDYLWTHILWGNLQQLTPDIKWYGPDYISGDATDYSSELVKIAAAKPDAIVNLMGGTNENIFARQRASDPVVSKIPIFGTGILPLEVPSNVQSLEATQPRSTQYYNMGVCSWYDPKNPKSVAFLKSYVGTYGTYPDYSSAAFSYDAIYFLAQAITKAGTTNPDTLVSTMEQLTYQGSTGVWAFDSSHSLKIGAGYVEGPVVQWVNSLPQVVWPSRFANATWVDPRTA